MAENYKLNAITITILPITVLHQMAFIQSGTISTLIKLKVDSNKGLSQKHCHTSLVLEVIVKV